MSPSPTTTANNHAPTVISAMNNHTAMVISAMHADGATAAIRSSGAYDCVGVRRRQSQAGDEYAKSQTHQR
jgi:hypothetical protein